MNKNSKNKHVPKYVRDMVKPEKKTWGMRDNINLIGWTVIILTMVLCVLCL